MIGQSGKKDTRHKDNKITKTVKDRFEVWRHIVVKVGEAHDPVPGDTLLTEQPRSLNRK